MNLPGSDVQVIVCASTPPARLPRDDHRARVAYRPRPLPESIEMRGHDVALAGERVVDERIVCEETSGNNMTRRATHEYSSYRAAAPHDRALAR